VGLVEIVFGQTNDIKLTLVKRTYFRANVADSIGIARSRSRLSHTYFRARVWQWQIPSWL